MVDRGGPKMHDETDETDRQEQVPTMATGLDAILATLLLSRQVHVDNFSLAGSRQAKIELSGDGLDDDGLSTLSQVINLASQVSKINTKSRTSEADSTTRSSFWHALKEFALPDDRKARKKK